MNVVEALKKEGFNVKSDTHVLGDSSINHNTEILVMKESRPVACVKISERINAEESIAVLATCVDTNIPQIVIAEKASLEAKRVLSSRSDVSLIEGFSDEAVRECIRRIKQLSSGEK